MNDFEAEIAAYVERMAQDSALFNGFLYRNKRWVSLITDFVEHRPTEIEAKPFPATFAAMQVTLYDNWQGPKPPSRNYPYARYGLDLKLWETAPTNKKGWHHASIFWESRNLWMGKEARSKAKRLVGRENNVYPVDEVVVNDLAALKENGHTNMGILHSPIRKKLPTRYFPGHYATMDFVDREPVVTVYLPTGFYTLSKFTFLNPNGRPLVENPKLKKSIGQVRIASDPALRVNAESGWGSGECVFTPFG